MASPKRSAKSVGNRFKKLYYDHLENSPEVLHKYYNDTSQIVRPGLDGTMRVFTLSDVDEKDLRMLSFGDFDSVKVTSVLSLDSLGGGVLVVVEGYFTSNERPARNFTQSFLLAPQEPYYFVFTDIFKFRDMPEANETISPANEGSVIEEHVPKTEGAADESSRVSEPKHGFANVPKLSDASVVMKGKGIVQGQHSSSCDHCRHCAFQAVSDAASIYASVPREATISWVENAFKQFGAIRRNGIGVRRNLYNTVFALVEFEEPDAAKRAVMAAPVIFDGCRLNVRWRRIYSKKARN